jgi:hypothetical protein
VAGLAVRLVLTAISFAAGASFHHEVTMNTQHTKFVVQEGLVTFVFFMAS